jgi:DNA-binding protein HU-beta
MKNRATVSTQHLVTLVREKLGISKKDAEEIVSTTIDSIVELLVDKGAIQINNLGTLRVTERPARVGINPSTQDKIMIEKSKSVNLRPSVTLKRKVNDKDPK